MVEPPIGFVISQTAKTTARAFEDYLFEEGGSLSQWLVLLALQEKGVCLQTDLAGFVGVQGSTLTHHLNAMESKGWILRTRTPEDRRVHRVTLTRAGRRRFLTLRKKARMFNQELRGALSEAELVQLRDLLNRIAIAAADVAANQPGNPDKS